MAVETEKTEPAAEPAPVVEPTGAGAEMLEAGTDSAAAEAESAPIADAVADGQEYPLHPQSVLVARLCAVAFVTLNAAGLLLGVLAVAVMTSLSSALKLAIFAAWLSLAVFAGVLCYRWPQLRYEHIRYRVDERGFTVRRGVFWRSTTSVPKARVQHTDVAQGPLQRNYGLASLVIHTAGTQDASVTVSGLPHEAALRIRDYLIEGGDRVAG